MADTHMLSVIVPVYNVEKRYLGECLDSILGQTYRDFELIIVDDGASDDIRKYLDAYDFRGSDARIIRQSNAGVAVARNKGIDAAEGKYITFIDSDDTIERDCFEGIIGYAEKNATDVLMWGLKLDFGNRQTGFSPYLCDIPHFTKEQKEEVQFKTLVGILPFYVCPPASSDAAGSACAKLYKREFIENHRLRYTPGLKRAEDMEFNLRVFDAAEHIGYLYRFYYNYRQLDSSATYTYRDGGISVFAESLYAIREHLIRSGKSELFFQVYYMRCMFFFLESMDMDYLNPCNPKPFGERIRALASKADEEPFAEAFANLSTKHLTFARKIPLYLIRHGHFTLLAMFYSVYRKIQN